MFSSIIVWGRSIGTGPATEIAALYSEQNKPLGGLILQSPYLSIKSLAKTLVGSVVGSMILNRFNNRKRIKQCKSPVLVIHGEEDQLIPLEHAKVENLGF
jgi:abhydrolase domain-containing protein 17